MADDVDPKGFFDQLLQQVGVDIEAVLLREFPHAVQRAFDHLSDCGNLHPRVRAKDRDGLLPLLSGDGQYAVEDQGGQHGAVPSLPLRTGSCRR